MGNSWTKWRITVHGLFMDNSFTFIGIWWTIHLFYQWIIHEFTMNNSWFAHCSESRLITSNILQILSDIYWRWRIVYDAFSLQIMGCSCIGTQNEHGICIISDPPDTDTISWLVMYFEWLCKQNAPGSLYFEQVNAAHLLSICSKMWCCKPLKFHFYETD